MNASKKSAIYLLVLGLFCLQANSCSKKTEGCTDVNALNFDLDAEVDNGSCFTLTDFMVGEWFAQSFQINNMEQIGTDLVSCQFFLEETGEMNIEVVKSTQQQLSNTSTWQANLTNFSLQFNLEATGYLICTSVTTGYNFGISIRGQDWVELETLCPSQAVKITLVRN